MLSTTKSKNSSLRGVIFDLYGTLFVYKNMEKAFASWHESLSAGAKELGVFISASAIAEKCDTFFLERIPNSSELTFYEERLVSLFKKIGLSPPLDWLCDFSNRSMDSWQNEVKLHPEALFVLKQLREAKIKTAILSNFDHYPHVYRFLDKTGLTPWVDEIVVSGEIRLKKPDAKIFEYTLKKLGLLPSEALMVGDDYEKDIIGAKNIGISTYFQKNGDSLLPILYLLEKGL